MARVTVAGWWVERTDEGLAAGAGFGDLVVEGEDGVAGAVGAVGGFVFAADDGEGVENVGGVEFAAELEAARYFHNYGLGRSYERSGSLKKTVHFKPSL